MRSPSGEEDVCVNCGRRIALSESPQGERAATEEELPWSGGEQKGKSPRDVQRRAEPDDEVSDTKTQKLADKMVAGWTLMADHCPRYDWGRYVSDIYYCSEYDAHAVPLDSGVKLHLFERIQMFIAWIVICRLGHSSKIQEGRY